MTVRLILAKGREKSLLRRHPRIFSGAVARMEGKAQRGETIDVCDSRGKWLARAAFSPDSQIRARVWSWQQDESVDIAFLFVVCRARSSCATGWPRATALTAIV